MAADAEQHIARTTREQLQAGPPPDGLTVPGQELERERGSRGAWVRLAA
jgi:hypothetical protein